MGSGSRAGWGGEVWGALVPQKESTPPSFFLTLTSQGPLLRLASVLIHSSVTLDKPQPLLSLRFLLFIPGGVGAGDFSISSRSNQQFTACDSKAGAGTPAALTPSGSLLGMQAPRPSPGPRHLNPPFNKTLRGSMGTLKCVKPFQQLCSLGDFRDERVQGLSQRECFTTFSGLRKLL